MAMNDRDEDLNPRRKRREADETSAGSGKSFRFALIMVSACVVVSLVVGRLLPQLAPAPSTAPLTAAAVTPTARSMPKTTADKISYPADPSGHFFVDAMVNGVEMRFLVDTGATFVALSPDDAAAAGIAPQNLSFDEATNTANGVSHVARTSLRSIRLGQLEIVDVAAVVMEQPMPISLLGMSFLSRLDGYSIREGVLTIDGQ